MATSSGSTITSVETLQFELPSAGEISDATMRMSGRSALVVRVRSSSGHEGLGVSGGSAAIRAVVERPLKEAILGEDAFDIERHWNTMFWRVRGIGRKGVAFCAISAIDIALWDLKAKMLDLPLYKLLGAYTDRVPVYGSGGWTSYDETGLIAEQAGYVERGFRAVKMKVAMDFGRREREDVRRLAAVRKALGDDVDIFIDANNGYYAKQAIRMAREFEPYRVGWFEEPVLADDIEGLAAIARAIDIPVATGEHEYTKFGFKDLIARGGADIVQPDIGRVGGVTEWLKVAHLAHAFNLPVASHAYQLIHLHVACATPNMQIVEYLGSVEQADRILFEGWEPPRDGYWSPDPQRPGLGLELSRAAIEKYAV